MESPVIITGMHRSGTSLVAQILNKTGLNLGAAEDLLKSNYENRDGYFEARFILELHEEMLGNLNASWKIPPDHLISSADLSDPPMFVEKAWTIVGKIASHFWGFKDPRASIFLPFWLEMFPELRVVVCVRSPLEVAYSLNKRNSNFGVDFSDGVLLWEKYNTLIQDFSHPDQMLVTHFESYLYDPVAEISRIYRFLGKDLSDEKIQAGAAVIKEEYFQSGFPYHFWEEDPAVSDSARALYKSLEAQSGEVYQRLLADEAFRSDFDIRKTQQLYTQSIEINQRTRIMYEAQNQQIEQLSAEMSKQERLQEQLQEEVRALSQSEAMAVRELQGVINSRSWRMLNRAHIFVLNYLPFLLGKRKPEQRLEPSSNIQGEVIQSDEQSDGPVFAQTSFPFIYPGQEIPTSQKRKILYVYQDGEGLKVSRKYRVENVAEYLSGNDDFTVQVIPYSGINSLSSYSSDDFDALVFFRLPFTPQLNTIVEQAKVMGKICVYDIDDFVFDLSISRYVDPLQGYSHTDLEQYYWGVQQYRKLIQLCHFAISPTEYLSKQLETLGVQSFVLPNGLNQHQEKTAERLLPLTQNRQRKTLKIGYLSGTNTHNKDFGIAAPAIRRILAEYPDVMLSIRGVLTLPEELEVYSDQIEKLPLVPYEELLEKTADLDIVIAPLEKNPYTQAKSELKYFEPAILQIPVVASDTQPFEQAITSGENGFIARTEEDWYEHLKALVEDPALRARVGQAARVHALAHYGVKAQAKTASSIFDQILPIQETPDFSSGLNLDHLTINWVIPIPSPGSGGHRVIFELCQHLAESGHQVNLYFMNNGQFSTSAQLNKFLKKSFFALKPNVVLGTHNISSCDALFATSWSSVGIVQENKSKARELFYFVQDFESLFFPMSVEYVVAYSSYGLGMNHITIGSWLSQMIREKFNGKAKSFPFPIDHETYTPPQSFDLHSPPRLAYFARKNMARRCYPLGVETLKILNQRHPEIEILLYGTNYLPPNDFPYPHQNLGVLRVNELAELYRTADVGLTFTTTNPSIVPYEMMASGLPVVDLDFNDNHVHYGGRENISLAFPAPNTLADAIAALIYDEKKRLSQIENGLNFVKGLPSRKQAAVMFEGLIKEYFTELGY